MNQKRYWIVGATWAIGLYFFVEMALFIAGRHFNSWQVTLEQIVFWFILGTGSGWLYGKIKNRRTEKGNQVSLPTPQIVDPSITFVQSPINGMEVWQYSLIGAGIGFMIVIVAFSLFFLQIYIQADLSLWPGFYWVISAFESIFYLDFILHLLFPKGCNVFECLVTIFTAPFSFMIEGAIIGFIYGKIKNRNKIS